MPKLKIAPLLSQYFNLFQCKEVNNSGSVKPDEAQHMSVFGMGEQIVWSQEIRCNHDLLSAPPQLLCNLLGTYFLPGSTCLVYLVLQHNLKMWAILWRGHHTLRMYHGTPRILSVAGASLQPGLTVDLEEISDVSSRSSYCHIQCTSLSGLGLWALIPLPLCAHLEDLFPYQSGLYSIFSLQKVPVLPNLYSLVFSP